MRNSNDRVIVYGMMIAVAVMILVVFSACTSGTGPAYQGPGVTIDVDGHKKTAKPKSNSGGIFTKPNTTRRK